MDIVPFSAQARAASTARDDPAREAGLPGSLEAFLAEFVTAGGNGPAGAPGAMLARGSAGGAAPAAPGVAVEPAQAPAAKGRAASEGESTAGPDASSASVLAAPIGVALPDQPANPARRAEVPAGPVNATQPVAVSAHAFPSPAGPGSGASVAPDPSHPPAPAATGSPGMPAGAGVPADRGVGEAKGSGRSGIDAATDAAGGPGSAPPGEARTIRPRVEVPLCRSERGEPSPASGAANLRVRQRGGGPPETGDRTLRQVGDPGRAVIRILDAPWSTADAAAAPTAVVTGAGVARDGPPLQSCHMPAAAQASAAAVALPPVAKDPAPVQVAIAPPSTKPAQAAAGQPDLPTAPSPDLSVQVMAGAHAGGPDARGAAAGPGEPTTDAGPPPLPARAAAGTPAETGQTIAPEPASGRSEDALAPASAGEAARPAAGSGGEHRAAAAQSPLPHGLGSRLAAAVAQFADRPVEVTLSPEELGRVRLSLVTHDGALTMTVQADRPETLDLLRRNIDQLAQDFRDLGFRDLSFSFGDRPRDPAPEPEIRNDEADGHAGIRQDIDQRPGVAEAVAAGPEGLDLRL